RCRESRGHRPHQAPDRRGRRGQAHCGAGEDRSGTIKSPMTARIIDGKTISADLRGKVTDAVHRLRRDRGVVPGIAVVLVGDNPASEVYVRNKAKAVAESGMRALDRKLPVATAEADLLALIAELNADEAVNGILVQLPLPKHIDAQKIIAA